MIQKGKNIIFIILTCVFWVIFNNNNSIYAATVGEQLPVPENGWQRYDDTDPNIVYTGTWETENSTGNYLHTGHYTETNGKYQFKFYGTKIRLIVVKNTNHPTNIPVKIDGITYTYSEYSSSAKRQVLGFEKTDLEMGSHTVEVTNPQSGKFIHLDAIDVDGQIIPYDSTYLTTIPVTGAAIGLKWDLVDYATGYIVKRSLAQGTDYISIDTITDAAINTYIDGDIEYNISYYYVVVPLFDDIEGTASNEVIATFNYEEPISGDAILTITYTNGLQRTYDLSINKIYDFINWYESAMNGDGISYFKFEKNPTSSIFKKRFEYVIFDKISNFDVEEY